MPYHTRSPEWEQHAGNCSVMRSRVHQFIGSHHFDKAIELSKEIPLPWYRVQSIAAIAKEIPDERQAQALLKSGLDIAMQSENPYKRTAVCAWLIAAASHRALQDSARHLITHITPLINTIEPLVSKADALALLWQAPVKLGPPHSSKFYEPLVWSLVEAATTLQQSSYKRLKGRGRAHMANLTLQLWPLNHPLAEKVLAANPDPAHAERTRTRAERGETYSTFFA